MCLCKIFNPRKDLTPNEAHIEMRIGNGNLYPFWEHSKTDCNVLIWFALCGDRSVRERLPINFEIADYTLNTVDIFDL